MGRRAVVEQTKSSRKAVVLRKGGDPRGKVDLGFGIAGAILMLLAIILVPLLPEDEPVPDQYQVTYEPVQTEIIGTTIDLAEGASQDIPITYDGAGLYYLAVEIEWTDDRAASVPDRFEMTVLDPTGVERHGPVTADNPHPDATGNPAAPTYEAQTLTRVLAVQNATRPSTQVITAQPGETMEDITAEVNTANQVGGTGDWILRVTLLQAGDCPDPFGFDPARLVTCQAEGADDAGNSFTMAKVTFTEYIPTVTLLEP